PSRSTGFADSCSRPQADRCALREACGLVVRRAMGSRPGPASEPAPATTLAAFPGQAARPATTLSTRHGRTTPRTSADLRPEPTHARRAPHRRAEAPADRESLDRVCR